MSLAPNKIIFAEEWVKDRNGKRAAIAAGYAERSAEVTASRLLRNANVKAYIDELLLEAQKRRKESLDDILNELDENRKIALSAETPQAAAANQSTMAKAKLLGYVIDKSESSVEQKVEQTTTITLNATEAYKQMLGK